MKKLALFLMVAVASTFAQIEPTVGLGMSPTWGDGSEDYSGGLSYSAGVQYRLTLGGFGVLPGVFYSSKSSSADEAEIDVTMNFIEAPLLVSFPALPTLNLLAGPVLWSNLGGTAEAGDQSLDVDEDLNALGFSIAAGVDFTLMPMLNIGARYQHQLSNISTADGADGGFHDLSLFVAYSM